MADDRILLFSSLARRGNTFAAHLLGFRGDLRSECPDEGADRSGISGGRDRAVPDSYGKSSPLIEIATVLEHTGFLRDRGSLAHLGRHPQSQPRDGAGFSVVLFCERTYLSVLE